MPKAAHRSHAATPARQPAAPPEPNDSPARLPLSAIDPNPWNPRSFPAHPDSEDLSLIESIRRHGVLQQLLVRPAGDGRYQLIFGERRFRCAAAAGLTDVPVQVRSLDDPTSRLLTATENLHQKPLPFLDEAAGIAALFEVGWTHDQVAAELGKSVAWVARRRRLLNLTPAWRRLAEQPDAMTAPWRAGHFEQIAKLEPTDQDALLTDHRYRLAQCETPKDIARLLGERVLAVATFPWDLDDATLDPVAGACSTCPCRSSHHPGLFDDQEIADDEATPRRKRHRSHPPDAAPDRCLSPACAAHKADLFVSRQVVKLEAHHPGVVRLQDGWQPGPLPPGTLRADQVEPSRKGAPGAIPAVHRDGPKLGSVRWVKPIASIRSQRPGPTTAPQSRKLSLDVRKQQRQRRRKIHAIDLLQNALTQQHAPDLEVVVRLAIVFGTDGNQRLAHRSFHPVSHHHGIDAFAPDPEPEPTAMPQVAACDTPAAALAPPLAAAAAPGAAPTPQTPTPSTVSDPDWDAPIWSAFADLGQAHPETLATQLWTCVLPVLLSRMTPDGVAPQTDVAWDEACRAAQLVGLDSQPFLDRATAALSDPKSWAAEEAAAAKAASSEATPAPSKFKPMAKKSATADTLASTSSAA